MLQRFLPCAPRRRAAPRHATPRAVTQERERQDDDICDVQGANNCVLVNETKVKVDLTKYQERHVFAFDVALDELVTNDQASTAGIARV